MRAFVTGSTGLLGSNLVRELVAQGHEVRALARSHEKARRQFGELDLDIVVGDMERVDAFSSALTGCDVLFHTAAFFREYYAPGDHVERLRAINVEATATLMEEAHRRGVKVGVDTSSSGIIGLTPSGEPGDESTPPHPVARENLYFKSKLESEERLKKLSAATGFPVVFVLPGWMFGPGDAAPTASGQLVLDFLAGKLPGAVDGGSSAVDARDVAHGMILAATKGKPGERYILGGTFYTLSEIFAMLAEITGKRAPFFTIPYPLALAASAAAQTWARMTSTSTVLSVEGVRTMNARLAVTSAKAERELGATFRPLRETLRDEVKWLTTHMR